MNDVLSYEEIWSAAVPTDVRLKSALVGRGFLVVDDDEVLALSHHGHGGDARSLPEVLRRAGFIATAARFEAHHVVRTAFVRDELDAMTEDQLASGFGAILSWKGKHSREGLGPELCWAEFCQRTYGWKLPVQLLDAGIAFFVKSLSAAGVCARSGCSGLGVEPASVHLASPFDAAWVRSVIAAWGLTRWLRVVGMTVQVVPERSRIGTVSANQPDPLQRLYPIAMRLYRKRFHLRELRRAAIDETLRRMSRRPGRGPEDVFGEVLRAMPVGPSTPTGEHLIAELEMTTLELVVDERGEHDVRALMVSLVDAAIAFNARDGRHGAINPRNVDVHDARCVLRSPMATIDWEDDYALRYLSPERVRGLQWDEKSEVFTLAAIAHELLNATPLFGGADALETLEAIRRCALPSGIDVKLAPALSLDPAARPALVEFREVVRQIA